METLSLLPGRVWWKWIFFHDSPSKRQKYWTNRERKREKCWKKLLTKNNSKHEIQAKWKVSQHIKEAMAEWNLQRHERHKNQELSPNDKEFFVSTSICSIEVKFNVQYNFSCECQVFNKCSYCSHQNVFFSICGSFLFLRVQNSLFLWYKPKAKHHMHFDVLPLFHSGHHWESLCQQFQPTGTWKTEWIFFCMITMKAGNLAHAGSSCVHLWHKTRLIVDPYSWVWDSFSFFFCKKPGIHPAVSWAHVYACPCFCLCVFANMHQRRSWRK